MRMHTVLINHAHPHTHTHTKHRLLLSDSNCRQYNAGVGKECNAAVVDGQIVDTVGAQAWLIEDGEAGGLQTA